MVFQTMNHGLEARATSPPRIKVTHNLEWTEYQRPGESVSRWSGNLWARFAD